MLAITLTDPWDPGSINAGASYTKCYVCRYEVMTRHLQIVAHTIHGTPDGDGDVVPGAGMKEERHTIKGTDFTAIMAATSAAADEAYAEELERQILDWIVANVAPCAGTVETVV